MDKEQRPEAFKAAGMLIPKRGTKLSGVTFWRLTDEGWRFVVDEEGKIIAYYPPSLSNRLHSLKTGKS